MAETFADRLVRPFLMWLLVVIFPAPLLVVMNAQMTDAPEMKLYISLGTVAYSWWLLAILLSTRPTWLDRQVGLPQIYALHGLLGVFAIGAAYLHRDNTFAAGVLARDLGEWAFWGAFVVLCYSVIFLSGWITDRSAVLAGIKRWLEIVFRHQFSVWIHRLNLVAVVLVFVHVHVIDRVSQHFWFMALFDLYTVGVLTVWVWRKWGAPDGYLTGTVQSNTALNQTTRKLTVALDRPADSARPGDFYFLCFEQSSLGREWHPFSATDANREILTFTIRQTGDFTRNLGAAPTGTRVRLEGPFGRFDQILQTHHEASPVVLIGMGAGVAPLLGLIAANARQRRIHLLWSVRSAGDNFYSELLKDYRHESDGKLQITTQIGRFHHDQLDGLLTTEQIQDAAFFVVGPNPAVLATERVLRRIGVSRHRVHQERLTM
jgi:predicted ferric reductase